MLKPTLMIVVRGLRRGSGLLGHDEGLVNLDAGQRMRKSAKTTRVDQKHRVRHKKPRRQPHLVEGGSHRVVWTASRGTPAAHLYYAKADWRLEVGARQARKSAQKPGAGHGVPLGLKQA